MISRSLAAALVVTLALPAAAQAQAALSPADQQRTVCAPKRDKAGKKIGGEICMTGAQWQKALAKVRLPARYRDAAWGGPAVPYVAASGYYRPSVVVRPDARALTSFAGRPAR